MEISKVSLSALQNTGSWIFLPDRVELLGSVDNKDFESAGIIISSETDRLSGRGLKEYGFSLNKKYRYIRVHAHNFGALPDWHPGSGSDAWLFVDEVIIE